MASAAKLAVAETAITENSFPDSQEETGYISPAATSNVSNITISDDGTAAITITYTRAAGDGTIVLKPTIQENGDVTWSCKGGTLKDKYRPVSCR